MTPLARSTTAIVIAAVASRAAAQPAQTGAAPPAARSGAQPTGAARPVEQPAEQPDAGYIGREITPLEIDDCKPTDLAKDEVFKQGAEHFDRGEILYSQGDYEGAVRELV